MATIVRRTNAESANNSSGYLKAEARKARSAGCADNRGLSILDQQPSLNSEVPFFMFGRRWVYILLNFEDALKFCGSSVSQHLVEGLKAEIKKKIEDENLSVQTLAYIGLCPCDCADMCKSYGVPEHTVPFESNVKYCLFSDKTPIAFPIPTTTPRTSIATTTYTSTTISPTAIPSSSLTTTILSTRTPSSFTPSTTGIFSSSSDIAFGTTIKRSSASTSAPLGETSSQLVTFTSSEAVSEEHSSKFDSLTTLTEYNSKITTVSTLYEDPTKTSEIPRDEAIVSSADPTAALIASTGTNTKPVTRTSESFFSSTTSEQNTPVSSSNNLLSSISTAETSQAQSYSTTTVFAESKTKSLSTEEDGSNWQPSGTLRWLSSATKEENDEDVATTGKTKETGTSFYDNSDDVFQTTRSDLTTETVNKELITATSPEILRKSSQQPASSITRESGVSALSSTSLAPLQGSTKHKSTQMVFDPTTNSLHSSTTQQSTDSQKTHYFQVTGISASQAPQTTLSGSDKLEKITYTASNARTTTTSTLSLSEQSIQKSFSTSVLFQTLQSSQGRSVTLSDSPLSKSTSGDRTFFSRSTSEASQEPATYFSDASSTTARKEQSVQSFYPTSILFETLPSSQDRSSTTTSSDSPLSKSTSGDQTFFSRRTSDASQDPVTDFSDASTTTARKERSVQSLYSTSILFQTLLSSQGRSSLLTTPNSPLSKTKSEDRKYSSRSSFDASEDASTYLLDLSTINARNETSTQNFYSISELFETLQSSQGKSSAITSTLPLSSSPAEDRTFSDKSSLDTSEIATTHPLDDNTTTSYDDNIQIISKTAKTEAEPPHYSFIRPKTTISRSPTSVPHKSTSNHQDLTISSTSSTASGERKETTGKISSSTENTVLYSPAFSEQETAKVATSEGELSAGFQAFSTLISVEKSSSTQTLSEDTSEPAEESTSKLLSLTSETSICADDSGNLTSTMLSTTAKTASSTEKRGTVLTATDFTTPRDISAAESTLQGLESSSEASDRKWPQSANNGSAHPALHTSSGNSATETTTSFWFGSVSTPIVSFISSAFFASSSLTYNDTTNFASDFLNPWTTTPKMSQLSTSTDSVDGFGNEDFVSHGSETSSTNRNGSSETEFRTTPTEEGFICWKAPNQCRLNKLNCGEHGKCASEVDKAHCECSEGYAGVNCEVAKVNLSFLSSNQRSFLSETTATVLVLSSNEVFLMVVKTILLIYFPKSAQDSQVYYQDLRSIFLSIGALTVLFFQHPGLFNISIIACRMWYCVITVCYSLGIGYITLEAYNVFAVVHLKQRNSWSLATNNVLGQPSLKYTIPVLLALGGTVFATTAIHFDKVVSIANNSEVGWDSKYRLAVIFSAAFSGLTFMQSFLTNPQMYSRFTWYAMRILPSTYSPNVDPVSLWTREEVLERYGLRKEGVRGRTLPRADGMELHTYPWTPVHTEYVPILMRNLLWTGWMMSYAKIRLEKESYSRSEALYEVFKKEHSSGRITICSEDVRKQTSYLFRKWASWINRNDPLVESLALQCHEAKNYPSFKIFANLQWNFGVLKPAEVKKHRFHSDYRVALEDYVKWFKNDPLQICSLSTAECYGNTRQVRFLRKSVDVLGPEMIESLEEWWNNDSQLDQQEPQRAENIFDSRWMLTEDEKRTAKIDDHVEMVWELAKQNSDYMKRSKAL
ncbi:hypothetical protein RB195_002384 [Necator americanus]|uniref:EGF-like domain-containing protein n=1 Tax=Necator americanus TaxID=51031 RepID=A0ABR1DIT7_NECAM